MSSELLILLRLNLIASKSSLAGLFCEKIELLCYGQGQGQRKVPNSVNVHLDDISSTAQPSVTRFAMEMHHYGPVSGHSKGSYDQNMTAATISSELLILLLPNLVW